MLMKNTITLICGISSALLLSASAWGSDTARTGQLPDPDKKFIVEAVAGGRNEVQLGQMASQKAANPAVRDFGTRMARDHSGLNEQLARILTEQGITEAPDMAKTTRSTGQLQSLNGPDFDHAYMRDMIRDHENDLAAFKNEAANGRDPEIRNWAAQTVLDLEKHLQEAEQTESSLPK
jgi:putative membrane protein